MYALPILIYHCQIIDHDYEEAALDGEWYTAGARVEKDLTNCKLEKNNNNKTDSLLNP